MARTVPDGFAGVALTSSGLRLFGPRYSTHAARMVATAVTMAARLEGTMASKDKGGRSTKKVAAQDLKQKRLAKKTKREDADRKAKARID